MRYLFEMVFVQIIEPVRLVRVQIENCHQFPDCIEHRYDDFRQRARIASDVPRECMNIGNHLCVLSFRGGSADTGPEPNLLTPYGTLVGTDSQQRGFDDTIESDPTHCVEIVVEHRDHARHGCDRVVGFFE